MINPTAADIGRKVVYRPPNSIELPEEGIIKSMNEHYVFVTYGNSGPKATLRKDLEWLEEDTQDE